MNSSLIKLLIFSWFVSGLSHTTYAQVAAKTPETIRRFVKQNCVDCHEGKTAEAGLDLTQLAGDLNDQETFTRWVRIFDRVHNGEMPPKDSTRVSRNDLKQFLTTSSTWLSDHQSQLWKESGRVQGRRLTNLQLERSLHSLLGVDLPLASLMPEEQRTGGFTTVANFQPMSHFQLEQHLKVVDTALDEAFSRAILQQDLFAKKFNAQGLSRTNPKRRTREPELINGFAVTWSSRMIYYGRLPATTVRKDGWYRCTVRAKSLNSPQNHGVWCTVRSGKCVSSAPLLDWIGQFQATNQVQEWTFDAWLPKGDMLEIRPGDDTLKMGRFAGGQVGTGEGGPQNLPGVAIQSIEMQEIHLGANDEEISEFLFDDLKVKVKGKDWQNAQLISSQPKIDSKRLLQNFAERAFRRPVAATEIAPYIELVQAELDHKKPLLAALRTGYRALLCSPRFLYFEEPVGELNSYALASRLSYFLWNAPPDNVLLNLAKSDRLKSPTVLREQTQRMLKDPRGEKFVSDFAAQWLDLSEIDFTTPDRRLYPGFDVIVEKSMVAETQRYLQEMLNKDLSVHLLIDSKFTYLNERLARYYGINKVDSDKLEKVLLTPADRRGGLVTQGAILKVTANGTATSPVLRGVWISERLLGTEIPPPPASVPAIEPDVRGAKTIREMLEKHKSDPACASCHVNIDPPGFALENFDPAGRWRDNYIKIQGRKRSKGPKIDPSHVMPNGQRFETIDQFQKIVANDRDMLAANLAEHLLAYGTGAHVSFADRDEVEAISQAVKKENYGFRSIIEAVVLSDIFRMK